MSAAGLVPVLRLAEEAKLRRLAEQYLSVPTDRGANAGLKVASLVGGMVAGADSIEDMRLLRHGGMGRVFDACYAPSTLGSFLRAFTFGHVRQLDAVAARFLSGLAAGTAVLPEPAAGEPVLIDVDDTIVEVHGYAKQGAGFGHTRVRGLNALLATVSTSAAAPLLMGAWHQERDAKDMPIYEFTAQLATLEAPPPEMQQLLAAVQGNQQAMDAFVSVISGVVSPADYFSQENIGNIFAAAAAAAAAAAPALASSDR